MWYAVTVLLDKFNYFSPKK